jgi:hypothetical protein
MVHSTLVVQPGCHGRESVKTMSYTVTTMEAWDARSSLGHRRPTWATARREDRGDYLRSCLLIRR